MKTIFFVDPQSYNNLGDYDKYLLENIDYYKKFYCSDKLKYQDIANSQIIRHYHYGKYNGLRKVVSYCLSQIKLFLSIVKSDVDIIHFQWLKIPYFDLLLLKCIKLFSPKTKMVFTAHNILPHDTGNKYKKVFFAVYRIVDKIIVHAESTKKEITQLFNISEQKIVVIPHGFLPLGNSNSSLKLRKKLRFSFIGVISPYKGLDLLINAWCNDIEILNNSNIELLIAGAGIIPELSNIPTDKNIKLENYYHTEAELEQIYRNTDVAVLPYRQISQSGVLLTCMAQKIPVIISNIGGLSQPFQFGKCGWILPDVTSEFLHETLKDIINNPVLVDEIKNDSKLWNSISDFYSWEKIGEKTFSLYKELCID